MMSGQSVPSPHSDLSTNKSLNLTVCYIYILAIRIIFIDLHMIFIDHLCESTHLDISMILN